MTNEEIVKRIQNGENLQEELYTQNVKLIRWCADRTGKPDMIDDLQQEGFIALVTAAEEYDETKGKTFGNYALNYIMWHLWAYIRKRMMPVCIPSYRLDQVRHYRRFFAFMIQQYGREPSDNEIMTALRITDPRQLSEIRKAALINVKSLDETINIDGLEIPYSEIVPDEDAEYFTEEVEDEIFRDQLKSDLWKIVDGKLSPEQSIAIHMKYESDLSVKEISEATGMKQTAVTRNINKGLRELRNKQNKNVLRPYYEQYQLFNATGLQSFLRTWTSSVEREAIRSVEREHADKRKENRGFISIE